MKKKNLLAKKGKVDFGQKRFHLVVKNVAV